VGWQLQRLARRLLLRFERHSSLNWTPLEADWAWRIRVFLKPAFEFVGTESSLAKMCFQIVLWNLKPLAARGKSSFCFQFAEVFKQVLELKQ
jgi:hypothetical protein